MPFRRRLSCLLVAALLVATAGASYAQAPATDTFRVAVGQLGLWAVEGPRLGQHAGIFKKHGITLDIFGTAGGGETLQAGVSRPPRLTLRGGTPPGPPASSPGRARPVA